MYHFDGFGWVQGVVEAYIEDDGEEDDDGDLCNFNVYYEADDTDANHALTADRYSTRRDAPIGSWYVVAEE